MGAIGGWKDLKTQKNRDTIRKKELQNFQVPIRQQIYQ